MAAKFITANVQGGAALKRHLNTIISQLGVSSYVKVGFIESDTYPENQKQADRDGLSIRGKNKARRRARNLIAKGSNGAPLYVAQVAFWSEFGTKRKNGKTATPARPFFRTMVASKSPRWGIGLGVALRQTNYNAKKALEIMGAKITGDLRESISKWRTPGNAKRTIREKGFDKPLINTAVMERAPTYEVVTGSDGHDADD